MDYRAICKLVKHHRQTFGRTVKNEIYKIENGRMLAITRLHDDHHDMDLAILLSESFCIEEIAGRMDRTPYPCCETMPLDVLSRLKGIVVTERGGIRQVRERIPRELGCTHIYEIIESAFRAIFVSSHSILYGDLEKLIDLCPDEHRQLGLNDPVLAGSCYAFDLDAVDPDVLASAQKKLEEALRKREKVRAIISS